MAEMKKYARPYARALFEYASSKQAVAAWGELLQTLTILVKEPQVAKIIQNPNYQPSQLTDFFIGLLNSSVDAAGKNFIKLLAENDRLSLLPDITELFFKYRTLSEKKINVYVESVVELDASYQDNLQKKMSAQLGRAAVLHCRLNPDLIGGILIRADDLVIDGSIRGQFQRLKQSLI